MKNLVLIICFIFIVSCSWRSPNSTFYTMNNFEEKKISDKKFEIAVTKVNVPDLLDRPQIVVYEKGSNKIEILEFNRWGESLSNVIQSTIVNDLIGYFPNSFITRTYFESDKLKYNVVVDINSIQSYKGDKVVTRIWWKIVNNEGRLLNREQKIYEVKVKGESIGDLVIAQNKTINLLSKDIAEYLNDL